MHNPGTSHEYRPEIDGLRAVAIVTVLLFHGGVQWLPGGFLGVDVFFVISGYLITSLTLADLDQHRFSLRNFWSRRIRRILPALLTVTLAVLGCSWWIVFRPEQQGIGQQALATVTSVANIYFWRSTGDYWGGAAENSPFLHAWSLSIEEQFYLLLPLVLCGLVRWQSRRLGWWFGMATLASYGLFVWACEHHPIAAFYLLPARAWELGVGSWLAVVGRRSNHPVAARRWTSHLATFGLVLIVLSNLVMLRIGAGTAVPVVGAALVLMFGRSGVSYMLLSHPVLVHIGQLSYSLYLWHWPVLVLTKRPELLERWAAEPWQIAALIYGLSFLTYRYVETPTRRRVGIVPAIGGALGIAACAAIFMAADKRFYDTSGFAPARYVVHNCHPDNPAYDHNPLLFGTVRVENSDWTPDAYRHEGIRVSSTGQTPEVMLFGDSHGCMWSQAVREAVEELGLSASFFCMDGVSPFCTIPPAVRPAGWRVTEAEQLEFDQAKIDCLRRWRPKVVIIGAAWKSDTDLAACDLIELLQQLGIRVLLIEDPPRLKIGEVNVMQWLASRGVRPDAFGCALPFHSDAEEEAERESIRSLEKQYPNVVVVETHDLFATSKGATVLDGRDVLYLDGDHLLLAGALRAVPRLIAAISQATPTVRQP